MSEHSTTFIDLTGQTFGLWTVIGPRRSENRKSMWLCECTCLARLWVNAGDLPNGKSTNCGCVRRKKVSSRNRTHGMTNTREYSVFHGMIARCENPKGTHWHRYGGRGVKICQRWRESFEAFMADMGPAPSAKHQLDRIDNDGDYEPGNCRWITNKENSQNKSNNRFLELHGLRLTLSQWAEKLGIDKHTIRERIDTLGWPVHIALTTPVKHYDLKSRG